MKLLKISATYNRSSYLLIIMILSLALPASPQNKKVTIDGHVKYLQNTWMQDFNGDWITWTNINNRLNLNYFTSNTVQMKASMRNLINYGQLISLNPEYKDLITEDPGWLDMTIEWAEGNSYLFYTNFDRAYIDITRPKWNLRAGRQRINWGIGLVWNPNDIFNTFSYFDFDYEERPGSDAIKLEYFTSYTSSAQAVLKVNGNDSLTYAGMYRTTIASYDIQLLAGATPYDIVIGGGWAGQIEGAGFRGEISTFVPKKDQPSQETVVVGSIDADYTFRNSLYIHAAMIYNSGGTTGDASWGNFLTIRNLTPKDLTPARVSLFGQVMYPITPIIGGNLAGMFNPYDLSFYIGPSLDISLREDLYLLFIAQLFAGDEGTEFGEYGSIFYLRLKYDF